MDAIAAKATTDLSDVFADTAVKEILGLGLDDSGLVNQVNEKAIAFARERAAEMVGKKWEDGELVDSANAEMVITDTTREMIRRIIADGLGNNIGRDAIADEIMNSVAFSEDRAAIIANFEVGTANSQGALQGMHEARDTGLHVLKVWYPDAEACEICLENADAGPIPLEDQFPSGDDAPLAHPNCECTLLSEVEETGQETEEE